MIGFHCKQRLELIAETRDFFKRRCMRCSRIFTQRKRRRSMAPHPRVNLYTVEEGRLILSAVRAYLLVLLELRRNSCNHPTSPNRSLL